MGEEAIYGASFLKALMANVTANATAAQALQAEPGADSPSTNAGAEKRAATPAPLTSEEALQQALAEELTLLAAYWGVTGYWGVSRHQGRRDKPRYEAMVRRGGKQVHLCTCAS